MPLNTDDADNDACIPLASPASYYYVQRCWILSLRCLRGGDAVCRVAKVPRDLTQSLMDGRHRS